MLCHPLYFHLCWLVIFVFFIDLITFVLHEQPVPQRLNLFFPGSRHFNTSQQNLFVPKPLHNPPPTVEFICEMNGYFFSPVFQSWRVFPLPLTFPSSSGCVLAGSQIKRCIMFLNQLCMAELHWEPGVSMNQLKCPTGVAVTLMCYILTTHCREIECWVGLNVMESSLEAF